jgi:hypothetical protein
MNSIKKAINIIIIILFISISSFAQQSDIDGDGIIDKDDKCIYDKGTKANQGCPEEKKSKNSTIKKETAAQTKSKSTENTKTNTTVKESNKVLGLVFDSLDFTVVRHVIVGSAAYKAEFYKNDKIVKVNNIIVQQTNVADFTKYLKTLPDKITFEVERKNTIINLEATKTEASTFLNKCISGDCINGFGTYTYADYSSYIGEFINGKKSKGFYKLNNGNAYDGNFLNEKFDGYGECQYKNGAIYKGEWKKGKEHGNGTFIYAEKKRTYKGGFVNGKKEGYGELIWDGIATYKGDFYNNTLNGFGIYIETNNYKYEGHFTDAKRHGDGIMTKYIKGKKDEIISGIWDADKLKFSHYIDRQTFYNKAYVYEMKSNSPTNENVFLGTLILITNNDYGIRYLYSYQIFGKSGTTLKKTNIEKLEESLLYNLNKYKTYSNPKEKMYIYNRSFDKDVTEEDMIKKIKNYPTGYGFSDNFSDNDIVRKGKYEVIEIDNTANIDALGNSFRNGDRVKIVSFNYYEDEYAKNKYYGAKAVVVSINYSAAYNSYWGTLIVDGENKSTSFSNLTLELINDN